MRKLIMFNLTSVNGFFERGPWGLDWHNVDAEFNEFAIAQLDTFGTLLFGRVTYQGMAGYWPTPQGASDDPEVARRMNALDKVVVSRTLERAEWHNTRIVRGRDLGADIGALKAATGGHIALMGSSDLAVSLAALGLIDEYRILVNPIALPAGRPLFTGLAKDLRLALADVRPFRSGNVMLSYRPAEAIAAG